MKFREIKIPKDRRGSMREIPVGLFKPYVVMVSPVYVLLSLNEKFLAVKAPLNFFTEDELARLRACDKFYIPDFVESVRPFQKAGEAVRRLLGAHEEAKLQSNVGPQKVLLPCAPHELDDAILRVMAPLWSPDERIEPFFLTFFSAGICDSIDKRVLAAAFEESVELFELGLLRSSFAVFLALLLGIRDQKYLSKLRDEIFQGTLRTQSPAVPSIIARQLHRVSSFLIPRVHPQGVTLKEVESASDPLCSRLRSRISRIRAEFVDEHLPEATLYGKEGVCDE